MDYRLSEDDIAMLLEASKRGYHKTLDGNFVKLGTQECKDDIQRRIEDMSHHRNDSDYGTDARSYFSGILRVYRRKLRENDKLMATSSETVEQSMPEKSERQQKENSLTEAKKGEQAANRMLKLAGML